MEDQQRLFTLVKLPEGGTYKPPSARIPPITIFLAVRKCKAQTAVTVKEESDHTVYAARGIPGSHTCGQRHDQYRHVDDQTNDTVDKVELGGVDAFPLGAGVGVL